MASCDCCARGLTGVRLVISDQLAGLVAALTKSFQASARGGLRDRFGRRISGAHQTCGRCVSTGGPHRFGWGDQVDVDVVEAGPTDAGGRSGEGGSAEFPEPFQVDVDLSGTSPGDTVVVVARGCVGVETDPGEFSAIPLQITGS